MANTRRDPVSYQPFRTKPLLAEGLLAVERPGGDLLQRVSSGLFQLADAAGVRADRQAERQGARAGEQAALAGRPQAEISGGEMVPGNSTADPGRMNRALPGDLRKTISDAALRHGVDPNAMLRIAMIESRGDPNAKNPNSTAGGLFQFVDGTARAYGLKDRFNPADASDAAARLARDNMRHLKKVLGRDPTAGELYLAHQQGAGGAAKLLKNPDGDAVSTVGADAVRLNGGRAGMSNREFASLWTRRAGDGPTASTRTPVEISATGGTFRPGGRDSIYGRAFDEAGSRTYVQTLETEMRSTTQQVFERYRDDPVALEKALGDLKGVLKKDHVFAEIDADFDVGYDRLAETYLGQARENLRREAEAEDRADFIDRTGTLETEQQKRLAAFDPKDPNAADAIASSQAAIDEHYDDAVRRRVLDPDDAARAKLASRREAALGFYSKQADALDADGIAAMRKEMETDFADGGLEGLDGEGWQKLDAGLQKLETQKRREAARETQNFQKRGDALAARLAAGFEIDQAELSKLMLDAGATPDGKAAMQETFAKISAGRAIRDFSVADGKKHVTGLRKQYGDAPTDGELRTLAFAETMLADKAKKIATDPVSYAEANQLVPETPLLFEAADAGQMADIMTARAAAADDAAAQLGIRPRYLKAGEAKALADAVKRDPAAGVGIAGAIVAGSGDRAAQVLAEFGTDAPMIADAGAIVASGGSARAAEDVILGYGKGVDGKQLKGLKPAEGRESYRKVAGSALALAPNDAARIERAAGAITRRRISEAGLDPASEEAIAIHEQAVQEAAGAVFDRGVQYGGFAEVGGGLFSGGSKVLVSSDVRADRFGDVLAAVNEADLQGLAQKPKAQSYRLMTGQRQAKPLTASLAGAVPIFVNDQASGRSGYIFAVGDPASDDPQFVEGSDGRIFVLDVMALKDRLAPRVPGAFR